MKNKLIAALLLSTCMAGNVLAADYNKNYNKTNYRYNNQTQLNNFVQNATIGNRFEIKASRLALLKSTNPEVRQFARHIIDDHSASLDDLRDVADSKLPTGLDNKYWKEYDKLDIAPERNFDRLYINAQIKAHQDAINLFRNYARNGRDSELRNYAEQTLPTLEDHYDMARELRY